jgi:NAD(P)-dependent dehydrogenase (short-subunit alcohol dehydrogenase family)
MHEFQGETAVVTGAASGIGLGMAKALAGAGLNVALCDLRPGPLEQAGQTIGALGVKAIGIPTEPRGLMRWHGVTGRVPASSTV